MKTKQPQVKIITVVNKYENKYSLAWIHSDI